MDSELSLGYLLLSQRKLKGSFRLLEKLNAWLWIRLSSSRVVCINATELAIFSLRISRCSPSLRPGIPPLVGGARW